MCCDIIWGTTLLRWLKVLASSGFNLILVIATPYHITSCAGTLFLSPNPETIPPGFYLLGEGGESWELLSAYMDLQLLLELLVCRSWALGAVMEIRLLPSFPGCQFRIWCLGLPSQIPLSTVFQLFMCVSFVSSHILFLFLASTTKQNLTCGILSGLHERANLHSHPPSLIRNPKFLFFFLFSF